MLYFLESPRWEDAQHASCESYCRTTICHATRNHNSRYDAVGSQQGYRNAAWPWRTYIAAGSLGDACRADSHTHFRFASVYQHTSADLDPDICPSTWA